MSEQPASYQADRMTRHPTPTAAELAAECIDLIRQLERHRLNVSLLLRARSGLLLISGYKQNRNLSR